VLFHLLTTGYERLTEGDFLAFGILEGEGCLDVGGFWKEGLLEGDCLRGKMNC
jgi:hypothetical protein